VVAIHTPPPFVSPVCKKPQSPPIFSIPTDPPRIPQNQNVVLKYNQNHTFLLLSPLHNILIFIQFHIYELNHLLFRTQFPNILLIILHESLQFPLSESLLNFPLLRQNHFQLLILTSIIVVVDSLIQFCPRFLRLIRLLV